MNLVRTSLLNGIAVMVKTIAALVLNKVFAVTVGPAGYALIGQLQNTVSIITNVGSGAINNGVVKYTAEYSSLESSQIAVWQTATRISAICSIAVGCAIALLALPLSRLFLGAEDYALTFVLFGLLLPAFVLNALLLAILNGRKEIARFVATNIAGSLVTLALTIGLTQWNGLRGALIALSINQSVALVATLIICWRTAWFTLPKLWGPFNREIARKLAHFAVMLITSAVAAPITQILIRSYLASVVGLEQAGLWQAAWKISDIYLMLLTTTLATYFLPRFAELTSPETIRRELLHAASILAPALTFGLTAVYLTRGWWIPLLFSASFDGMREVLPLQLLGDFFKMAGWLLGYLVLSKALSRLFVGAEILFSVSFYCLTLAFVPLFGLKGVVLAHTVNYIGYCVALWVGLKQARAL